MKIIFLFLIFLFVAHFSEAQGFVTDAKLQDSAQFSVLEGLSIERDARLDKMLDWHIEKNKNREGMEGFRVEIFFSSSPDAKEKALETKADFLSEYPEFPVHIKFIAPNFRVRVGDFRTKNEAWKLYKEIKRNYPTAFVVPDIINFPQLKANQNE